MKDINKIRIIVLLAGFISMELEILGTRLISPIFGSTIYVWTSLIGVTLAFLALGYWYSGKLADKGKININKLGVIILALGIYISILPFISRAVIYLSNSLGIIFGPLITSLAILAFPIFFLGFVVPSSVKFSTHSLEEIGKKAGEIYALATIGSIIGTFVTGFFLILYIGVIKTSLVTGIILVLLSLFVIKKRIKLLSVFLIPLLILLESRYVYPSEILESFDSYYGQVRVMKHSNSLRLYTSTLSQTAINTETKENEMVYITYFEIPFIYNSNYKKVLMIGLSGGAIAKELVNKYNLEMDAVEIEPRMLDLAKKYFYWNDEADVYFDDGRHFLNSAENYDIIIIDVTPAFPAWNLFTLEAFKQYSEHLNDDGMLLMNVISAKEGKLTKTLHKTLKLVFKEVLILRNTKVEPIEVQNIVILASKKEIDKDKFATNLAGYSSQPIEEMLKDSINFNTKNAKLSTDDFPIAEFYDYENWQDYGTVGKGGLKYFLP